MLVLLYEKEGRLRVLLTTRAKTLRMYPGQTALPGGKMHDTDSNIVGTAVSVEHGDLLSKLISVLIQYREAFEEVGLPMNDQAVHTLCLLRPFFATPRLLVTPVVALLTDLSVLGNLKPAPGEVDQIFDHPLEAILDPDLSTGEDLVALNSERWPTSDEFYVSPCCIMCNISANYGPTELDRLELVWQHKVPKPPIPHFSFIDPESVRRSFGKRLLNARLRLC